MQVDFMASWCGKCRMLAPHVEALQAANPGIKFFKFDTSKDGLDSLAKDIGVTALPVFKFYKDGKEAVSDVTGYKKKPLQDAVGKLAAL
jgi:thioredoxin 1